MAFKEKEEMIPMSEETKAWIDNATYNELLAHHRFAPTGDPMFSAYNESSAHFAQVFDQKRKALGPGGHTAASKAVGWDG